MKKYTTKKNSGILQLLPFLLLVLTSIGYMTNMVKFDSFDSIVFGPLLFLSLIIYTLITLIALSKEFPSFLNWVAILFLILWAFMAVQLSGGKTWEKQRYLRGQEKEIKKIDKELAMNPSADLYLRKAGILDNLFHKKRAMDNYQKAFDLEPTSYSALSNLVGFHSKNLEKIKQLYLKASQAFTEAQKLDPNNAELYMRGAGYYSRLANLTNDSLHYQKALDNYSQFLKLRPNNSAYYYERRAILYEYFKSYDKAISDYEYILGCNCFQNEIDPKRFEQKIEELKGLK